MIIIYQMERQRSDDLGAQPRLISRLRGIESRDHDVYHSLVTTGFIVVVLQPGAEYLTRYVQFMYDVKLGMHQYCTSLVSLTR